MNKRSADKNADHMSERSGDAAADASAPDSSEKRPRTISGRGASGVALASVASAGSGLLIMVIAGNSLAPADFASFSIFWGAIFAAFGTLGGIQQEATRAVRNSLDPSSSNSPGSARVLPNALITGGALAALGTTTSPLWAPHLLGSNWMLLVILMAVTALSYSGHMALAGASAGRQWWNGYSLLMASEAIFRLVLIVSLAIAGAGLLGLEGATLTGAVVWLVFVATSKNARSAVMARADVIASRLRRTTGHAMLSALSTAVLIVGFPVLLGATSKPSEIATAGGLLLAIQLTRAPIMVPLQAFQGVAVSAFVAHRKRGTAALLKPLAICGGTGFAGAIAAGLLGPWIMSTLFPGRFNVGGPLLASLTFDAALMAAVTLTGTAALALGHHRIYSTGWVMATAVAISALLLPLPIDIRCTFALGLGPFAGIAIHILGINAASRTAPIHQKAKE